MQRIIYIPLLVIALVSAIALLVIKVRTPTCHDLNFAVPISGRVDEKVSFVDSTSDVKLRVWDFGDSTEMSSDRAPFHRYSRPGKYIVTLTINGGCKDMQQIEILPRQAVQVQLAQIQGPPNTYIGDAVHFSEMTPNATSWEWTFGESGKVDAKTRDASYAFHTAGYKTVTVYANTPTGKLNGTFTINVKAKEAAQSAPVITPKTIAEAGPKAPTGAAKKALFESKLKAFLTAADMNARPKLYGEMNALVCDAQMQVLWITPVLKKNKKKTFGDFCQTVIGDKDVYTITELNISFDDAKDCVSAMTVKMKAK